MNTWSHVACVYDLSTMSQQVWLNGVLDGSQTTAAYQGTSGDSMIGAVNYITNTYPFNGYIDQVRYTARAKSSTEILNDATLMVYYSFDGGSYIDNGPNGINATLSGSVSTVTGRVNQALQFSSGSYLYYTYSPFYFLGISNQPFTIALWAKPTGTYTTSTMVFIYNGWCVHFVNTFTNGQMYANLWNGGSVSAAGPILSLNTWTHIGYTFSYSNGIKLYINGNLYSSSGIFSFSASGLPMYMILGSDGGNTYCSPSFGGVFNGVLDEFYLYNRQLTAAQIWALANP